MKYLLKIALLFYAISIYSVSFSQNYQISGGAYHTVALNEKGEVYTWGDNTNYQLGVGSSIDSSNVPLKMEPGMLPFISKVSGGSGYFTLALACDGTVWAWGANGYGQLGNGDVKDAGGEVCESGTSYSAGNCDTYIPQQVLGGETGNAFLENIVVITGGLYTSYALTADGKVLAWGDNQYSQCGVADDIVYEPIYIKDENGMPIQNVIAVSATDYGCFALIDDNGDGIGTVYGWGRNTNKEFGNGASIIQYPTAILNEDEQPLENIVKIAAGATHGLFIDDEGFLWAVGGVWGGGNQLGTNNATYDPTAGYASKVLAGEQKDIAGYEEFSNLMNVQDIAAGMAHSLAVVEYNGERYMMAWGTNRFEPWKGEIVTGMLGNGTNVSANIPQFVLSEDGSEYLTGVEDISASDYTSIAQVYNTETDNIETFIFGGNYYGQVGDGTNTNALYPKKVTLPDGDIAQPKPIADLGEDRVVCPSEMNINDDVYFELYAGSIGEGYTYEWKCTKNINGEEIELSADEIKAYMYGDKGQYFKAYFPGTYSVTISYDTGESRGCLNYSESTDEITLKYPTPTFTSKPQVFCENEAEFVVQNPTGIEYAIYATEDAIEASAVKTTGGEDIVFSLDKLELEQSFYNIEGEPYHEDSIFYKAWVEDVSTYTATIAGNVNAECEYGIAYVSDYGITAQRVMVYADKVNMLSVKIDVPSKHDVGKTVKPVLFGERIYNNQFVPDEDIMLAEGEPVTISGAGIIEIPINFELEGDAKYGKSYWIGFLPDESFGLKKYKCNNYPYVDDYKGDVQILSYAERGYPMLTDYEPTGPGFDWKVEYPTKYPCGRIMVEAKQDCNVCETASPVSTLKTYGVDEGVDVTVSISLNENRPNNGEQYNLFVFAGEIRNAGIDNLDFSSAITHKLDMKADEVFEFELGLADVGDYTAVVYDAGVPVEERCFKKGYFNVIDLNPDFDVSLTITDGTDPISPSKVTFGEEIYNADENGNITLPDLIPGTYEVLFSAEGYYDYTETIEVVDSDIAVDIVLEKLIVVELYEEACGSYDFGGEFLTESGNYTKVFKTADGRDSTVNLHLTIYPEFHKGRIVRLPTGYTYQFGGEEITESGSYSERLKTVNGCDSTFALSLSISDDELTTYTFSEFSCGSYEKDGVVYIKDTVLKEYDVYEDDFFLTYSIKITNIFINPEYEVNETLALPSGHTYQFGEQEISESGTYTETFETVNGCDSVVTLNVTISDEDLPEVSTKLPVCGSYEKDGVVYTENAIFKEIDNDGNGSFFWNITEVEIYPEYELDIEATIDEGQFYEFDSDELTVSGEYRAVLQSKNQCDSIVNLKLTVVPLPITVDLDVQACNYYKFDGDILFESGDYTKVFTAVSGVDSTVNLHLTINQDYNTTDNVTINKGQTYQFGTQELTEAGEYTETFISTGGCDSVVTLTLSVEVLEPYYTHVDTIVCFGPFILDGEEIRYSGEYTRVYTAENGADSIVTYDAWIGYAVFNTIQVAIHEGDSYVFGNDALGYKTLTETGTYSHIFPSYTGCDSVVDLELTVLPADAIITNLTETACGEYEFDGSIYRSGGIYSRTFTAKNGEDSTVNLNLTVNPIYNITEEVTIYEGESYLFKGKELTSAGDYTEVLTSVNGCDSTVNLTLTVITKPFITELDETVCGSYEFAGDIVTKSGKYSKTYIAKNGADSIVNLTLTVNPVYNKEFELSITEGDVCYFGTTELTETGEYIETYTTAKGCDSTVTLTLTVLPAPITVELDEVACSSFEFGDDILTESGKYTKVFTRKNGEDSTVNLSLTINPVYTETAELTINEGETYVFGTQELTVAGDYTEVFTSGLGCDSTVTLTLTVLPKEAIVTDLVEVSCGSFEFGDDILTESGEYSKVFTAKSGADSTVNLSLTINPVYNETAELKINEGETYVFGAQELTVAGEYNEIFTSVAGCDSTVTLTLTVKSIEPDTEINAGDNLVISIEENALEGTVIATLPATDKDGNTINYTISNTEDFEIVDGAIVVKNSEALDAESDEAVVIDVTIETPAGTETATVALDITDVDEAPELNLGEISVPENVVAGTVLATLPEFDEDGDKITYTLSDESAVKIENNTIVVVDPSAFDYETGNVSFELTASDGNKSITETIEIIVDNINDNAPVITLDSEEISILENVENGSVITVIKAEDSDGDDIEYSIEDIETLYWDSENPGTRLKTGSDIFAIDPVTGELTVADETALDYETVKGFIVTLKVSDGEFSSTEKLTILLSDEDVNENAPIITLDLEEISILENVENGSVITVITAEDADGDEIVYSIDGGVALSSTVDTGVDGVFSIDPRTGELTVAEEELLDYEFIQGFILTIKVSDGKFSSTERLTIKLEDVDEVAIESSEKTALVYPTIVTDQLSVDVSGNASVTISTVLGQIVGIAEITGSDNINVEKLNKGVYNVEIANKQGLLYKGFIIKK